MNQKTASLVLVCITAVWGSSFILMKLVAAEVPALGFLTLRFGLAGLLLAAVFCRRLRGFTKKIIFQSFLLGLLLCASMVLQIVGLRYTSVSNSGFITSLSVLMVPLMSSLYLKKRPTKSNGAGVVLALFGLSLITGIFQGFTALNKGDFYTFLCAVCVAVHMIMADRFLKEGDALLLGVGQTMAGAVLSFFVFGLQTPQTFFVLHYTPALFTAVLFTAIFCTAFAFTAQIMVQKYVPPAKVALIFTLEPVFAYLYALVIPGPSGQTELLTWAKVIGCILIVCGMTASELGIFDRGRLFATKSDVAKQNCYNPER